jgi:hypothetical protein
MRKYLWKYLEILFCLIYISNRNTFQVKARELEIEKEEDRAIWSLKEKKLSEPHFFFNVFKDFNFFTPSTKFMRKKIPNKGEWKHYRYSAIGNWYQIFSSRFCKSLCDIKPKAQSQPCALTAQWEIRCLIANYCARWRCNFKGLSQDGGWKDFFLKTSAPLSLMTTYQMSLISARSTPPDSTFKLKKQVCKNS